MNYAGVRDATTEMLTLGFGISDVERWRRKQKFGDFRRGALITLLLAVQVCGRCHSEVLTPALLLVRSMSLRFTTTGGSRLEKSRPGPTVAATIGEATSFLSDEVSFTILAGSRTGKSVGSVYKPKKTPTGFLSTSANSSGGSETDATASSDRAPSSSVENSSGRKQNESHI